MVFALAAAAASALVQAMVTDGWEGFRNKVAQLFGRGRSDVAIERRLDASTDQLKAARSGALGHVQAELAGQWETRFADFLADHPDAVGELEDLTRQMQASIAVATDHSFAARDVLMNADHGAVTAGVIHGDVSTGPTRPGPASS
jgi:hypothetical protein